MDLPLIGFLGSPHPAEPRSSTYERPWLRSTSFRYYLTFPDFLSTRWFASLEASGSI
jgi:hypothetical protein